MRVTVALFVVATAAIGACTSSSTNAPATGGAAGASTGGASTGGSSTGGDAGSSTGGASTGGSGGVSGSAGAAGGGATDAGFQCPSGVKGPALLNAGTFCIDATEVTNGDYDAFVKDTTSNPPTPSPGCTGDTHDPHKDNGCPTFALNSAAKLPVVCVDWCDAEAYCAWAGKRLCGAMGGSPTPLAQKNDGSVSEWYAACVGAPKGGNDTFFYGSSYDGSKCVGDVVGTIAEVQQYGDCHSYYFPKLFGMSGNASEWVNACDNPTTSSANCLVRGGSYLSGETDLACNASTQASRTSYAPDRGFRCCWDSSVN